MHTNPTRGRLVRLTGLIAALALVLGACGDDDDTAAEDDETTTTEAEETTTTEAEETTTTEAEETTTTVDMAAEEDAVGLVAVSFFDRLGAEDIEGAADFLENGEANIPTIRHCANLLPGASIRVLSTEFTDEATASMIYELSLNGEVVLPESGGGAVKADGEWLFAENSWLSLYDAAKDSCTGPAPAA
ncbi:hypothetical protein NHL50_18165 [Acidimicrobiia bacterium EGI L10123]|uniref:hypothetical protein n=1 Tax=Salinilacustrithrix flava TaxID=2957203 RepID=UPI003D7C3385|nr:hypothetical protein [Acidimicrobiia bacterium EGI L10123]